MATETAKYRVTYRGFREYANTHNHTTNVHQLLECDVVAVDAVQAISQAAAAFGEDARKSGDWKVCMLRAPQEVEFVGTEPCRSTIVIVSKMGA